MNTQRRMFTTFGLGIAVFTAGLFGLTQPASALGLTHPTQVGQTRLNDHDGDRNYDRDFRRQQELRREQEIRREQAIRREIEFRREQQRRDQERHRGEQRGFGRNRDRFDGDRYNGGDHFDRHDDNR